MRPAMGLFPVWFLIVLLAALPARAADTKPLARAVILEAAGRLDSQLAAVAGSARALGAAYAAVWRDTPAPPPEVRAKYLQSYAVKDGVVAFRDATGPCGANPQAMAPCQALLFYDGENFTDETFRTLAAMTRLAPAMAAAHDALPFSWVYLTTPGQNFAIYPYLPLSRALENYQPTQKGFYTAADFEKKACGWESPYLDLAGAGMMVTASCPIYDGDRLLGVASRDVTLAQLSKDVMADLAAIPGAQAIIMNRRGKAIAASDPKVAEFIVSENAKAGDAVVYFRADRGLAALGKEKNVESPESGLNDAAETVIERAETQRQWPIELSRAKDTVLAARLNTTGWYLVLVLPHKVAK
ncbi:histidine kinase [Desulfovibrio sp. JY]|nr:histidine kinase [Desulfovibrio sp. JY]